MDTVTYMQTKNMVKQTYVAKDVVESDLLTYSTVHTKNFDMYPTLGHFYVVCPLRTYFDKSESEAKLPAYCVDIRKMYLEP